jgi:hypothetical protein
MSKRDLGFNEKTGRAGVLFPDNLVDFRIGPVSPMNDPVADG